MTAKFRASASGLQIQIGAAVGSDYAVFTMQGKVIKVGKIQNGTENVSVPTKDVYLVRVENNFAKINVK